MLLADVRQNLRRIDVLYFDGNGLLLNMSREAERAVSILVDIRIATGGYVRVRVGHGQQRQGEGGRSRKTRNR